MSLWRSIFGAPVSEVWSEVARDVGGQFTPSKWTTPPNVSARIGGYDMLLDTYTVSTGKSSVTYTRLRAPFVNAAGLRFSIRRASIFSGLGALFGRQDIDVGDAGFDKDHIIQGNDVARVQCMLGDPALRALITAQPYVGINVVDNEGLFTQIYGPGVDVLTFLEATVIRDRARLVGLFSLFAALLRAVQQQQAHPLDVPPAEVPTVFSGLIDDVFSSYGGATERVLSPTLGDTLEARLEDPLGLAAGARVVVGAASLPSLATFVRLEAALPPSSTTFTLGPKGVLSSAAERIGLDALDDKLALTLPDGAPADARGVARAHARRLARPLARLAEHKPAIAVDGEQLVVRVDGITAWDAFVILGSALDLWQELERVRAGVDGGGVGGGGGGVGDGVAGAGG